MKWITRANANVELAKIRLDSPIYDALYAWCQSRVAVPE
jgi:hypothetical protein